VEQREHAGPWIGEEVDAKLYEEGRKM